MTVKQQALLDIKRDLAETPFIEFQQVLNKPIRHIVTLYLREQRKLKKI